MVQVNMSHNRRHNAAKPDDLNPVEVTRHYRALPGLRRRNAAERDADHPIEVTKHYRSGPPGYLSPWQRAAGMGQNELFSTGIKLSTRAAEMRRQRNPGVTKAAYRSGLKEATAAQLGKLVRIGLRTGHTVTDIKADLKATGRFTTEQIARGIAQARTAEERQNPRAGSEEYNGPLYDFFSIQIESSPYGGEVFYRDTYRLRDMERIRRNVADMQSKGELPPGPLRFPIRDTRDGRYLRGKHVTIDVTQPYDKYNRRAFENAEYPRWPNPPKFPRGWKPVAEQKKEFKRELKKHAQKANELYALALKYYAGFGEQGAKDAAQIYIEDDLRRNIGGLRGDAFSDGLDYEIQLLTKMLENKKNDPRHGYTRSNPRRGARRAVGSQALSAAFRAPDSARGRLLRDVVSSGERRNPKQPEKIAFRVDKRGKLLAYRFSEPTYNAYGNWYRIGLDDAKLKIATGEAVEVDYDSQITSETIKRPYKRPGSEPIEDWPLASELVNPGGQAKRKAVKLYESFSGKRAKRQNTVSAPDGTPAHVAKLGTLRLIKTSDGRTWKFNGPGAPILAADHRQKLHVVGGQYRANPPDCECGEIVRIEYETDKPHLDQPTTAIYYHELGEETGERPILTIDNEGHMHIEGGAYTIEADGIHN